MSFAVGAPATGAVSLFIAEADFDHSVVLQVAALAILACVVVVAHRSPARKRHPQPLLDYLRLSMRQPVAGCPVIHFLYVGANSRARAGSKIDSPVVVVLRSADSTRKPSRRWPLPVRHQVRHGPPWSGPERHSGWADRPSPSARAARAALAEGRQVRIWRVGGGSRISPRSWRNWMRFPYRIRDCGFSRRGLAPGPTRRYSSTCTPLWRT